MSAYGRKERVFKPRKKRSIKQLHTLWQRTVSRTVRLVKHTWDIMQEVYDTIEPNEKGERVVYAEDPRGTMMYAVLQKPNEPYLSFNRSYQNMECASRAQVIDAILDHYLDERLVELGQRLSDSERASDTHLHETVFEWFFHSLTQKLTIDCKKMKNIPYEQNFLIYVKIQKKSYTVVVKRYYRDYQFTWLGEDAKIEFTY